MSVTNERGVLSPDVPAHVQIYRQMRSEILDGLWIGTQFPGERALAERFGVSAVTSRAALERLAAEGLVERRRGHGTVVIAEPSGAPQSPHLYMFPPPPTLPKDMKYSLIQSGVDIAPAAACAELGVPAGSRLWQATRLLSRGRQPFMVSHNVQRPEVGERHQVKRLKSLPMASILESEGVKLATLRRQIFVGTAPPLVARHLGISIETPALIFVLVLRDEGGKTIEWVRNFVHPDFAGPDEVRDLHTGHWVPIDQVEG